MTLQASEALNHVDAKNTVISASPTTMSGLPWLDKYLSAGAGEYFDMIGYHFCVYPEAPETMLPQILSVRRIMAKHEVAEKPLWNTESGWAKPKLFPSEAEAAAYVSRSYVLNWAAGGTRFYWYAWDNHG